MSIENLAEKLQLLYNNYIAPYEEAIPITDYIELIVNIDYLKDVIDELENIVSELESENADNRLEINELKNTIKELKKVLDK